MADWVGHIIFAATIALFLKTEKKSLLFIGALLPDLLSKATLLTIFFPFDKVFLDGITYPAHTLIGALLMSFLFGIIGSRVVKEDLFRSSYLVFIGYASHLFLDLFNLHMTSTRGALLFPWLHDFSVTLLAPGEYLWFWVVLIPLYFIAKALQSMYLTSLDHS